MTACPHCGAAVRPGAPYCSLCHADFRPRPAVPPPSPVPVMERPSSVDPLTAPLLDVVLPASAVPAQAQATQRSAPEPTWPCLSCGAANALGVDVCLGCGMVFLAHARGQLSVVVPGVGDLLQLSRGQRLALAAGVALALMALFAVVGALLG